MAVELYRDPNHVCLMFTERSNDDGLSVQSNQFLIINHQVAALIDPGGNLGFNETLLNVTQHTSLKNVAYILASHADPDVIGSLDRWLTSTQAKLVLPKVWARFAPHFTKVGKSDGRIFGVPDIGGRLLMGKSYIDLLPAHFLHSEGNFHFYDPISKILFTGDLGVSLMTGSEAQKEITNFASAIPLMEGFHRRYMVSNKVLRLWVKMAKELDISKIVPQHGAPIAKSAIADFFQWLDQLSCGVDLLGPQNYQLPHDKQYLDVK